ncbi:hypothetical protein [Roseateles sp. LYH14W]|uniref:Uncharacterized protein n=1 Tax=Pelomonas parva TaxID=3299032 RepID=A0ABW7FA24_9BURK
MGLRVHDVERARADRDLYAELRTLTVPIAEEWIEQSLKRATASAATDLFAKEFEGVRALLASEEALSYGVALRAEEPAVPGPGLPRARVFKGLEPVLEEAVATQIDRELVKTLAAEFADGLWSGLLRQMRLSADGGLVGRHNLVPVEEQRWTPFWEGIAHFGVEAVQVQAIVKDVFEQLAERPQTTDYVVLPLGLKIRVSMLKDLLRKANAEADAGLWSLSTFERFLETASKPLPDRAGLRRR